MIEITVEVEGMKCGMCESHVNGVVRRVEGVKKVSSSHAKGRTVVVAEDGVNREEIVKAVTAQGYGVGKITEKPYEKRGLFGRKK
ncbi:MAG: cation transporter [Roseburia sp.]|nr:cation transporter [Roseburia sp.]